MVNNTNTFNETTSVMDQSSTLWKCGFPAIISLTDAEELRKAAFSLPALIAFHAEDLLLTLLLHAGVLAYKALNLFFTLEWAYKCATDEEYTHYLVLGHFKVALFSRSTKNLLFFD